MHMQHEHLQAIARQISFLLLGPSIFQIYYWGLSDVSCSSPDAFLASVRRPKPMGASALTSARSGVISADTKGFLTCRFRLWLYQWSPRVGIVLLSVSSNLTSLGGCLSKRIHAPLVVGWPSAQKPHQCCYVQTTLVITQYSANWTEERPKLKPSSPPLGMYQNISVIFRFPRNRAVFYSQDITPLPTEPHCIHHPHRP